MSNLDSPRSKNKLLIFVVIFLLFALSNLGTFSWTYIFSQNNFKKAVGSRLDKLTEEVEINSILRKESEVKLSIIEKIRQLTAKAEVPMMTIDQVGEIADLILSANKAYGIQPSMALAVMEIESSLNYRAVSSANAKGLMQVMDSTAKPFLVNYGVGWNKEVLFDPVINVRVALDYLRDLHTIHVAEGLEQENEFTITLLRYNRSQPAMNQLLEDKLGLQYTTRISQRQKEFREDGVM